MFSLFSLGFTHSIRGISLKNLQHFFFVFQNELEAAREESEVLWLYLLPFLYFTTTPGGSVLECLPQEWEDVGFESRPNPSSNLLSISLLISETLHINNYSEESPVLG